ncbi:MAG TPA: MarR family transcriptional regulator [Hyphomonadaceae bacterium]|nr:MarR family transcriptional regulator [Hyphomonadaceae bacterium]
MTTLADGGRRSEGTSAREAGGRRDEFRLSGSPSHLLRRAEQFAAETFQKTGLSDGVTLRQTVLLAAIAEAEGASQSDLVRATGVDRSTLAEMMARMERRGLIERSAAADDGRAKSVHLTYAGRHRLDAALPAMRAVDEALIAALPRDKRATFKAILAALALAVDAAHDETPVEVRKPRPRPKPKKKMMKAKSVARGRRRAKQKRKKR